jgi:hypothetical protein
MDVLEAAVHRAKRGPLRHYVVRLHEPLPKKRQQHGPVATAIDADMLAVRVIQRTCRNLARTRADDRISRRRLEINTAVNKTTIAGGIESLDNAEHGTHGQLEAFRCHAKFLIRRLLAQLFSACESFGGSLWRPRRDV